MLSAVKVFGNNWKNSTFTYICFIQCLFMRQKALQKQPIICFYLVQLYTLKRITKILPLHETKGVQCSNSSSWFTQIPLNIIKIFVSMTRFCSETSTLRWHTKQSICLVTLSLTRIQYQRHPYAFSLCQSDKPPG